ncbi:MAG: hypothetical protein QMD22_10345 [archaeon]|nr:hypothetical protein [archaeon]
MQKNAHVLVVSQPRLTKKCENWNKRTARLFACWCIRNTPLADGRKVWDLLTDERSRKAVEITERYVNGEATREELFAAQEAAWAVAWEAAWAMATWATAAQAAWEAARAAQETARAAARAAQVAKLIQILNGGSM